MNNDLDKILNDLVADHIDIPSMDKESGLAWVEDFYAAKAALQSYILAEVLELIDEPVEIWLTNDLLSLMEADDIKNTYAAFRKQLTAKAIARFGGADGASEKSKPQEEVGGKQVDALSANARAQLLLAQIEIYKLKANDHDWAVYVPDDVKAKLEAMLLEIDNLTAGSDLVASDPNTTSEPHKSAPITPADQRRDNQQ